MEVHVNDTVVPGDKAVDLESVSHASKIILGPGLRLFEGKVYVCKCGVLKKNKLMYWVECLQKRYIPADGEYVIGIVTNKAGDYFKVDIGASELASLSYLSFEGATKKHRPDINVGDALYTQVLAVKRDMEPELVCVDSRWKKGRLGLLSPNGFIFPCSLTLAQKCLEKSSPVEEWGKQKKFEIAVGMNGRIWIHSDNMFTVQEIINSILQLEVGEMAK